MHALHVDSGLLAAHEVEKGPQLLEHALLWRIGETRGAPDERLGILEGGLHLRCVLEVTLADLQARGREVVVSERCTQLVFGLLCACHGHDARVSLL